MFTFSVTLDVCTNTKPVGISDTSIISDNQLTASSRYGTGYQAAYGRLNGNRGDGWCAKEARRTDDWLQVDLGKVIQVCAVSTQGDRNRNEWTIDFKLSYSFDGNTWMTYKGSNGAEMVRHFSLQKAPNFQLNHRKSKVPGFSFQNPKEGLSS